MATFKDTTSRRDALMLKRLGASGTFVPLMGAQVADINILVEEGISISSEYGEQTAIATVLTAWRDDVGDVAAGDSFTVGALTYKVRKPLQDDGQVVSFVVV